MKIAVLSDAHGNIIYFDKVFNEIKNMQVDKIYYLGDFYGYGFHAHDIIEKLREVNAYCLLGNHDAMILNYIPIDEEKDKIYQIESQKEKIPKKDLYYLSTLVPFHEENIGNDHILFIHGSPFDPLHGYLYEDSEVDINIEGINVIFAGHTHRPFIKKKNGKLYVNVGSCGLPRDIGNKPSFAYYDSVKSECQIIRIEINQDDIERSCMKVHEAVRECLYRNTFYNQ